MSNLQFIVDLFQIRGNFDTLLTGPDYPSKLAPDIFLKAAEQLEAMPKNCIVIDNSHIGLEGAKRAAMHFIAIANTNSADAMNADLVIPNFSCSPAKAMEILF